MKVIPVENKNAIATLVVKRQFNHSAEKVFDAFLDPKTASEFLFRTDNGVLKLCEIDAKIGGKFQIIEIRGDIEADHQGTFIEISRPQRIKFSFGENWGYSDLFVSIDIKPNKNGCEVTFTQDAVEEEYREQTNKGWSTILENWHNIFNSGNQASAVIEGCKVITRRKISKSIEKVWASFCDPQILALWWGPDGFSISNIEFSFTNGSLWHFIMHGPDGTDYPNKIRFKEIDQFKSIRFMHFGEDETNNPFYQEISFIIHSKESCEIIMMAEFDSVETLEYLVSNFNALEGGKQTLNRLGNFVET